MLVICTMDQQEMMVIKVLKAVEQVSIFIICKGFCIIMKAKILFSLQDICN